MSETETGVNNKRAIEPNKRKPTKDSDNNNNNRSSSSWRIWINQAATNVSRCQREKYIVKREQESGRHSKRETERAWGEGGGQLLSLRASMRGCVCVWESALICVCICIWDEGEWVTQKTFKSKHTQQKVKENVRANMWEQSIQIYLHGVCVCEWALKVER